MLAASPASFQLERGDHHRLHERARPRRHHGRDRGRIAVGHLTLRRARSGKRGRPPVTSDRCPATSVTRAASGVRHPFLDVLAERVVVADGAMGTMLQDAGERGDLVLDDFAGLEGCNEILNDTRPDVVAGSTGPTSPRVPTPWRPTRSGRTCPTSRTTTSPTGSPAGREGRAARPAGCRRVPCRPAAVRARLDRTRDQAPDAGPRDVSPAARRYTEARPARRRVRRVRRDDARTCCRSRRPCWGPGGHCRGPPGAGGHPRHRRDHGHDAAGQRDRAALTAIEPLGVDLIGLNCAPVPRR